MKVASRSTRGLGRRSLECLGGHRSDGAGPGVHPHGAAVRAQRPDDPARGAARRLRHRRAGAGVRAVHDQRLRDGAGQYAYTYADNTAAITPSGYQQPTEPGKHCVDDPGNSVFHAHGRPVSGLGRRIRRGDAAHRRRQNLLSARRCPTTAFRRARSPRSPASTSTPASGTASRSGRGAERAASRCCACSSATSTPTTTSASRCTTTIRTQPRYCERVRECACINGLAVHVLAGLRTAADRRRGSGRRLLLRRSRHRQRPGRHGGRRHAARYQHLRHHPLQRPLPGVSEDRRRQLHPFGSDPAFANRAVPAVHLSTRSASPPPAVCYGDNRSAAGARPTSSAATTGRTRCTLTTDWQLYLVPFSWMDQQGFAKQFTSFDLKSVSVARFTWDAGPVDFYIDNWRFYRVKRPAADARQLAALTSCGSCRRACG